MSLALVADRIAKSTLTAIAHGARNPDDKMLHGICYLAQPNLSERSRERLAGLVRRRLAKAGIFEIEK